MEFALATPGRSLKSRGPKAEAGLTAGFEAHARLGYNPASLFDFPTTMRKAALLYNPESGGRRTRRQPELEAVLALLRQAGIEGSLLCSHSRDQAVGHARQAILAGCDTVFACGGDGTVHNVVQVLAKSHVALAVLPMGTANALAHDLRISLDPAAAARAALRATPRRIALGRIQCFDFDGKPAIRYFTIAAGIGVDAHLFYKLNPSVKARLGMAAYYAKAWNLWLTHRMSRFEVEYAAAGADGSTADTIKASVTELLAVRIRNFGGVLRELAPGASLQNNYLRLVLCHSENRAAYLLYVLRGLLGRRWNVPGIELANSHNLACRYLPPAPGKKPVESKICVEADGELLGTLPAEITIVPDALTLLAPAP